MAADVLTLISTIYDAATDVAKWDDVVQEIYRHLRVKGLFIINKDHVEERVNVFLSQGFESQMIEEFMAWMYKDPGRPIPFEQPVGRAVATHSRYSDVAWREGAYYHEYSKPHRLGIRIADDAQRTMFLGCARGLSDAPFGDAETRLLDQLAPHLKRALQISRQFADLQQQASSTATALDYLRCGIVLLGRAGRMLYANRRAEQLIDNGDVITAMNGLLSAQDTVANTSLQQLIQEVTAVVVGNEVPAGGSVFVHSELHKGAQLLSLFPMPAEAGPLSAIAHGARAIVFILEWDDMGSPPAAQLADYFGLTRAEARLAAALAKGASLEDCTVRFGISKNTVRSQIRAIFDKTGASRQGDLIARILRSPAGRCSSLLIGLEDQ